MSDAEARSIVRIELDGSGDATPVAPAPSAPTAQPIALILLLVGLAAGFVGLLAVSGGTVEEDAAPERTQRPIIGDIELSEEERVWISDVPLFSVVVEGIDGWYGVSGGWLYSADGPTGWERVDVGADRVLDVAASGDGVNVLTAAASQPGPETRLQVLRSTDGEFWKIFDEATVPAVVHSGSLNGTAWSVFAGPSAEPAGDDAAALDQVADRVWSAGELGALTRLPLAENDWVRGQVAVPGGAVAISQTVDFFSTPSGIELPTRLLRLTPSTVEDITPPDVELDADDRLIRSGDGLLWLVSGLQAWSASAPYEEWRLYADATDLVGVNRLDPVLNGGGLIASMDRPDTGGFWFTQGDGRWQEFTFPGVSELGVLLIDDGSLTVSAVVDGTRQVTIARGIDERRLAEVVVAPTVDGEWDLPAVAVAADGQGFVGLTNVNGSIGWFESADGLRWESTEPTDLPFGFFANTLERTDRGWVAVGQVGLLEDGAFVSTDGTSWARLEFELPRNATAVEIESVSTSPLATAVLGSLGWADNLARTERLLLWLPDGGSPVDVPPRPCPETQGACPIQSIAVLSDGVMVTHLADKRVTVSKWTPDEGWAQLGIDQPLPADPVSVQRSTADITYLGRERVLRSVTGDFWYELFDASENIEPYLGVSNDGTVAVGRDGDALVVRSAAGAVSYVAPEGRFGEVLAISNGAVIVRALTPDGRALARLEALAVESVVGLSGGLPTVAAERGAPDPDRAGVFLTVFEGELYESTDRLAWDAVSQSEIGAGRVLDFSVGADGLTLLLATPTTNDTGTWISVSRRAGEVIEWLGTTVVPLEVHGGSLNGTDWVVRAGPALPTEDLGTADRLVNDLTSWIYAGSPADAEPTQLPTGASELAVDVESTAGGALFLSVDLDFFNESPPSLQLKRWEPDTGVTVVQPGGQSVTEADHLWLTGDGRLFLARGNERWFAEAPYVEFVPIG